MHLMGGMSVTYWHLPHGTLTKLNLNWTIYQIGLIFFYLVCMKVRVFFSFFTILFFWSFFFFFFLRQYPCNPAIVRCKIYAVRASLFSSHGPSVQINLFMAIGNALFAFWHTFAVNAFFDLFTTRCHSDPSRFLLCFFTSILWGILVFVNI